MKEQTPLYAFFIMPETVNDKKIFSLLEVSASIQKTLSERYQSLFWVKAEMNKLHYYPHSGHCYPELLEKRDGRVIAQLKATLWRDDFDRINANFQHILKEPLRDGITILFAARITFDPVYGLSLRIVDIDPAFSLGELEKEKQETIDRLRKEGIFNTNRDRKLSLLPQRLAIISVQTSKGYADFLKMIDENAWGYKFFHVLFPSLLQGERAVESIRFQLDRIRKVIHHFDVVAIIRGGGGDIGLSCFNDFGLSREIATFPIPVMTGIGHATNETVVEMIAFKNAITPTELADFLLQKFHNFSVPVQKAEEKIRQRASRMLEDEKKLLQHTSRYFRSVTGNILSKNHGYILSQATSLLQHSDFLFRAKRQELDNTARRIRRGSDSGILSLRSQLVRATAQLAAQTTVNIRQANYDLRTLEKSVQQLHPENVLKRGYSITLVNGKAVTSHEQVKKGDHIQTVVADGMIDSQITSTKKSTDA